MIQKLAWFAMSLTTAVGFAGTNAFEYEVKGYPKTSGGCHEAASDVGRQIADATGVEIVQSVCKAMTAEGYDIRVQYRAEKALEPVSNFDSYVIAGSMGRYKKREDCDASLPEIRREFEAATNLTAALSFCSYVEFSERQPWAPRVDGFGKPRLTPFNSSYLLFANPLKVTGAEYREKMRRAVEAQGAVYSAFVLQSQVPYGIAVVHYYSEKRFKLAHEEYLRLDNEAQCLAAVPELEAIFAGTKNVPAIVHCGVASMSGYETSAAFIGEPPLRTRESVESYRSYDACAAARPGLVKYYKEVLHQNVVGGLCSQVAVTGRDYRVIFFEP